MFHSNSKWETPIYPTAGFQIALQSNRLGKSVDRQLDYCKKAYYLSKHPGYILVACTCKSKICMCYHKSLTAKYEQLAEYYSTTYSNLVAEMYSVKFHENGFDFQPGPVVTAGKPSEIQMFHWGLVPFWVKDLPSATRLKVSTLNCISEEMFEKPSYRDAAKEGKRCLIPCSGFFEWRWMDEKGKTKIPYFISLKAQSIFSLAGLYSRWMDKTTEQTYYSYTVLTTTANSMMSTIHNTKQRMPVILPREYEKDWLNRNLSKEDVLALCQPIDDGLMTAHTISKRITSKKEETNVPEILDVQQYEELNSK